MKTLFLYSSLFLISITSFSQKLYSKKAELLLDIKSKEQEAIQIKSTDLEIKYINNKPEVKSEGELEIGTLKTSDSTLQMLIDEYNNKLIHFNMLFPVEQFQNRSNTEFSFNSILSLLINHIQNDIPVTVIVSNSKSSQSNFYFISVSGTFSLNDFDITIEHLDDNINFSYRQNVQVKN